MSKNQQAIKRLISIIFNYVFFCFQNDKNSKQVLILKVLYLDFCSRFFKTSSCWTSFRQATRSGHCEHIATLLWEVLQQGEAHRHPEGPWTLYNVFISPNSSGAEWGSNGVLNSSKKQALFHHHFLVPARVPGLVSLLFWHPVPSSFPGSG